jgi:hypothetical protein
MGSERLSHMFTALDPTRKKQSSPTKGENQKQSSQHSLFHAPGTQPVAFSNGPKSSPPSSPIIKHKRKTNPKYKKLIKLYSEQLSHITTTLNAIESLSKTDNIHHKEMLESSKTRVNKLRDDLEDFSNSPSKQDHVHFDPLKDEIDQLINDLKSYKIDNTNPDSRNAIDHLIGFPLNVSDSDVEDEDGETLVYF